MELFISYWSPLSSVGRRWMIAKHSWTHWSLMAGRRYGPCDLGSSCFSRYFISTAWNELSQRLKWNIRRVPRARAFSWLEVPTRLQESLLTNPPVPYDKCLPNSCLCGWMSESTSRRFQPGPYIVGALSVIEQLQSSRSLVYSSTYQTAANCIVSPL